MSKQTIGELENTVSLARGILTRVIRSTSRAMHLPGEVNTDGPTFTLQRASVLAEQATHDIADGRYQAAVCTYWNAILLAQEAEHGVRNLGERARRIHRDIRHLELTVQFVEDKIKRFERLILTTRTQYGASSVATAFVRSGKACIVRQVSLRRAAYDNARHAAMRQDWGEAERCILAAKEAALLVDEIIRFVEQLIKNRFNKKATRLQVSKPSARKPLQKKPAAKKPPPTSRKRPSIRR